ncbi:MAG: hypothetical protein ACE15B_03260 [Bryobacteraceae bacterium]
MKIAEKIERFERVFWKRERGRPPVGVAPARVWSPVGFLRAPFPRAELAPGEVGRALARTEYEDAFAGRAVRSDDFMPYVAAWRAVPWLEAICGCPVRYSSGSLAPGHFVASAAELERAPLSREWLARLRAETAELAAAVPEECFLSTTILRGCSDVLAAMRGIDGFCLDLYDDPAPLAAAAARINRLHLDVLDMHFSLVPPKLGGYGHIFGYWAPGPTTVIQEDMMGLCAPRVYRELFLEHNAAIVEHLGPHVLFHLHSTGYRHYRDVLEIPGLAGLEITVEANGPRLADMLPCLRETLERSRLILMVDGWFEDLAATVRRLPREGLYVFVSDRYVTSEAEFAALLRAL